MIPDDAVVTYLNAHFRPEAAADLLAAAQPLMAIAWAEGHEDGFWNGRMSSGDTSDVSLIGKEHADATNPYREKPAP